jgi:decaprenylphospho-beta-D-erythro-pentofuranosid-2-ulose 2-reductase
MTAATGTKRVLLVGGTSEIGLAILRRLAQQGPVSAVLLGRDANGLTSSLEQLRTSGPIDGTTGLVQATEIETHERAIGDAFAGAGGFDVVVLAVGVLGAQAGLDADRAQAIEVMEVDFLGAGSLLLECLRRLRAQGSGTLVVLSTVAAERPRASNAIYGAAKAGLDSLAQGLADAEADSGARVLVVRPGFVKTRMTEGLPAAPLSTTADAVAGATVAALDGGAHTVWVPRALRYLFAVLRHLPRPIFRRLPL